MKNFSCEKKNKAFRMNWEVSLHGEISRMDMKIIKHALSVCHLHLVGHLDHSSIISLKMV